MNEIGYKQIKADEYPFPNGKNSFCLIMRDKGRKMNAEYLVETKTIDFGNPIIQEKVSEL